MKHQTVSKRSLPQAIELLEELDGYLETTTAKALSHSNKGSTGKPSGSQGTIYNQTKPSISMILNGLKDLEASVKEHNSSYTINLYTCLTVQGPVVRRPTSANLGLNFDPGFFFFCSKAFSPIIF